eukprot:INCI6308.1.p1 GENE.INCI6308.1~~INCI6308.1.p1  ORF type:complete len:339 (-),score=49.69 INCI6308.1:810-1826(-)
MKLLVGALWAAVAAAAGGHGAKRSGHGGETTRTDIQRGSAVELYSSTDPAFLEVDGKSLSFRGQDVFLSGANQPWVSYGNDFGNNQPNGIRCSLQDSVANVSAAGGNSIRMWLFVEGANIPSFDSSGHCNGTDGTNTLISDLRHYARFAASQNVFITLTLWNGAVVKSSDNVRALVTDAGKLQTFIDKALTPLVTALADEPGIGSWEIMNEPEGSVAIASDPEPCFDTTILSGSGAGWSGAKLAMKDLLKFHNLQAAAIHAADPKALVTVGRCEFVLPFRNRFLCLNHNLMALTGREVNMILFILRQLVATCKHRCTAQQYRRPRTKVLQLLQRRVFS